MNGLPTQKPMFLILVPVVLAAGLCGETRAQTYTVCEEGCSHTTVQGAVNDAPQGATILVSAGLYHETVLIDEQVTIQCADPATGCIVDAGGSGYAFTLSAPTGSLYGYIVLDGFTVTNGSGIVVYSWGNTVENNTVTGGKILLEYDANSNTITGNSVSGGDNCIELIAARANTISLNSVSNCEHGVYLDFDASGCTLSDNIVTGNSSHGIFLGTSGGVTVDRNTISANGGDGIHSAASASLTLTGNTLDGNLGHGMTVEGALFSEINGNSVTNNGARGIHLLNGSNQNTITANTIENNTDAGLTLENASDNLIYDNYLDNAINAVDSATNTWNTASTPGTNIIGGPNLGGNFWSDYAGADADSDGFGDTPHSVPGANNVDNLPLVPEPPAPLPDLVITDIREVGGNVCYSALNDGAGPAPGGHQTSLEIDGAAVATDPITAELAPGVTIDSCFTFAAWTCSSPSDTLTVCADSGGDIEESDLTNNCLTETWDCGPEDCDNGLDDDLDGLTDCDDADCAASPSCEDADSDGHPAATDCDDTDDEVYPGGDEVCDHKDNDCNGVADDVGPDTDGDWVGDYCDNCRYIPNPAQGDVDGDCVVFGPYFTYDPHCGDRCDNCRNDYNPGQEDTDRICNWVGDPPMWVCIVAPDGAGDECDNCRDTPNSDQYDNDSDGLGDACDNCPLVDNLDQEDGDSDTVGDACDTCWGLGVAVQTDFDGDCGAFSTPYTADPHCGDACDNCRTVYNPDQADHDILAYWALDEGTGTVAYDSANDNDFTIDGLFAPVWTTGLVGNALEFDSYDGFFTGLHVDCSDTSPGLTLEAWVYPSSAMQSSGRMSSVIFGSPHWGYFLQHDEWVLHVSTAEDGKRPTGFSVDYDTWQHVAAVFEPGIGARFYKNGEEFSTVDIAYQSSLANLRLGQGFISWFYSMIGVIDEVVVLQQVATQAAIQAHYREGLAGHTLPTLGDGLGDACDNCPDYASSNPTDSDVDGEGDVCDLDDDNDGCPDIDDDDPLVARPDSDSDGLGDDCDPDDDNDGCVDGVDPARLVYSADPDGDGAGDDCDNCPERFNSDQGDWDRDGVGDGCDCDDGYMGQYERGADCGSAACGVPCDDPCIPMIINGDPDDRIDLVFVPDVDYLGDLNEFLEDVQRLIFERLAVTAPIDANMHKFNFYYMEQTGDSTTGCGGTLPDEFDDEGCHLADAVTIVHRERIPRDCTTGLFQYTSYGSGMGGIFIHETGHGVFKLRDEYVDELDPDDPDDWCTGYGQNDADGGPPNIWSSDAGCRTSAEDSGWDPELCNHFCDNNTCCTASNPDGWWKIDHDAPEIMIDNQNDFGIACTRRINWILDQYPHHSVPAASSARSGGGSGQKTMKLLLRYLSDVIEHQGTRIGYGTPRDYRVQGGALYVSLLDTDGAVLYEFSIYEPRERHGSDGATSGSLADDVKFGIVMPFFADLRTVELRDSSGVVLQSIDVSDEIEAFCSEHLDDPDCADFAAMPVGVDIKPGNATNCLNVDGYGLFWAAVLGSADLDVSEIEVSTLRLAGLPVRSGFPARPRCRVEDVSGDFTTPEGAPDGFADLVCPFVDNLSLWAPVDCTATLTGELQDGTAIEGSDTFRATPNGRNSGRPTTIPCPCSSATAPRVPPEVSIPADSTGHAPHRGHR